MVYITLLQWKIVEEETEKQNNNEKISGRRSKEPKEPHDAFDADAFDALLQQGQSALEGEERRSAAETSPDSDGKWEKSWIYSFTTELPTALWQNYLQQGDPW